ncbi:MAG: oxidoreductase [Verrucomicrobiaceae bacterium]|nr:oxidoreductase [Verrucomicrobiaceae bacterium]
MLHLNTYIVREHIGFLKLSGAFDIIDPNTQQKIAAAREELGNFQKLLRLFVNRGLLPTKVTVYESIGEQLGSPVFSIERGFALFRSKVAIRDATGNPLGFLKSKFLSFGGAFIVSNTAEQELATVKGDWKGWNFKFLRGSEELGIISRKWGGLGKELFTSADNYVINIHGQADPALSLLLLAAGLSIDMVYKTK